MTKVIKFYGKEVKIEPAGDWSDTKYKWVFTCLTCNRMFESDRSHAQTCSDTCRVNFNREKKKEPYFQRGEFHDMLLKHLPPKYLITMRKKAQAEVDSIKVIETALDLHRLRKNLAMIDYLKDV